MKISGGRKSRKNSLNVQKLLKEAHEEGAHDKRRRAGCPICDLQTLEKELR